MAYLNRYSSDTKSVCDEQYVITGKIHYPSFHHHTTERGINKHSPFAGTHDNHLNALVL